MERVVLSWSGGKDATLALAVLRDDPSVEVVGLLTTVSEAYDRVVQHGVRRRLIENQAGSLGLPLDAVFLPPDPSNEVYEERMRAELEGYDDRGISAVAFGDLHLEDVRAYRAERLAEVDLDGRWPLWGRDPGDVARTVIDDGYDVTVVCVDAEALDPRFVGREYDFEFLDELPGGTDPCGENGEFHTFVHDGPIFDGPVPCHVGRTVEREVNGKPFVYCDLE